jgi:uncharacterized protein
MPKVLLCPSCRKVVPLEEGLRPTTVPFCSERCQLTDLGRWFSDEYTVPAPIGPDDIDAIEEVLAARQAQG